MLKLIKILLIHPGSAIDTPGNLIGIYAGFLHLGSDSLEVGIVYVNEVELNKSAQINERTLSELLSGLLSIFSAHYPHISRQARS